MMAVEQAADNNMTHAHCMLNNQDDKPSECIIITALSRQQCSRERASYYLYCTLLVVLSAKPGGTLSKVKVKVTP
jgi:hypothetical protein